MVAVPLPVNCAIPSKWMSLQYPAVASQKFTVPVATGFAPELTVAVSTTTAPDETPETTFPPEVTEMVVVLAAAACPETTDAHAMNAYKRKNKVTANHEGLRRLSRMERCMGLDEKREILRS